MWWEAAADVVNDAYGYVWYWATKYQLLLWSVGVLAWTRAIHAAGVEYGKRLVRVRAKAGTPGMKDVGL